MTFQQQQFTTAAMRLLNIKPNTLNMQQKIVNTLNLMGNEAIWFEFAFILNTPVNTVKQYYKHTYSKQLDTPNSSNAEQTSNQTQNKISVQKMNTYKFELTSDMLPQTIGFNAVQQQLSSNEYQMVRMIIQENPNLNDESIQQLINMNLSFRRQIQKFAKLVRMEK
ncbi:Hypothetical_protein [Hexamita inflata]|uniref:Hypothetical_protein n=2 Tax=Hexamita inflata TaxID=28002 RepID=A0ABP1IK26_9EUKA